MCVFKCFVMAGLRAEFYVCICLMYMCMCLPACPARLPVCVYNRCDRFQNMCINFTVLSRARVLVCSCELNARARAHVSCASHESGDGGGGGCGGCASGGVGRSCAPHIMQTRAHAHLLTCKRVRTRCVSIRAVDQVRINIYPYICLYARVCPVENIHYNVGSTQEDSNLCACLKIPLPMLHLWCCGQAL